MDGHFVSSLEQLSKVYPNWDTRQPVDFTRTIPNYRTIMIPPAPDIIFENDEYDANAKAAIINLYKEFQGMRIGGLVVVIKDLYNHMDALNLGYTKPKNYQSQNVMQEATLPANQLYFVFIHSSFGILLVLFSHAYPYLDNRSELALTQDDQVLTQISRGLNSICNLFGPLRPPIHGSVYFYKPGTRGNHFSRINPGIDRDLIIFNDELLRKTNLSELIWRKMPNQTAENALQHSEVRKLIHILIYHLSLDVISPVRCAKHLYKKMHQIGSLSLELQGHNAIRSDIFLRRLGVKHCEIVFDDKRRKTYYFTEEQRNAITQITRCLIIAGAPGSGKSLIFLTKIFIASQDADHACDAMLVVTSKEHYWDIRNFIRWNQECFVRQITLDSNGVFPLAKNTRFDIFVDELDFNSIPYFDQHYLSGARNLAIVLSSFSDWSKDLRRFEKFDCELSLLRTPYVGSRALLDLWQEEFHKRNRIFSKQLNFVSHFEGIQPEHYDFDHIDDCISNLEMRVNRLLEVENCSYDNIAVVLETEAVLETLADQIFKRTNYEYSFDRASRRGRWNFGDISERQLAQVVDYCLPRWSETFNTVYEAIINLRPENTVNENLFLGLSFIVAECRYWPFSGSVDKRTVINHAYQQYMTNLNNTRQITKETAAYRESQRHKIHWKASAISNDLKLIFAITDQNTDTRSAFDRTIRNRLSSTVDIAAHHAVRMLEENGFSAFCSWFSSFQAKTSGLQLFHKKEILSLTFDIIIILRINDSTALNSNPDADLTAVASSRALLHVINFSWNCNAAHRNQSDVNFLQSLKARETQGETVLNPINHSSWSGISQTIVEKALICSPMDMQTIGSGGFSTVYRYEDISGSVAVKILHETVKHQIHREAVLSKLNNDYILQMFGSNENRIVLEFMENGSIRDVLSLLDYRSIYRQFGGSWAYQCASGLAYLHSMGYIHRDVKPSNLFLCRDYSRLKIGDLGLLAHQDELQRQNIPEGTRFYMAPEVLNGDRYDFSVDVFSFAMTFYHIDTQNKPFAVMSRHEIAHEVVDHHKRPNLSLVENLYLRSIIERCWQQESRQRPTMAQVMIECSIFEYTRPNNQSEPIYHDDKAAGRPLPEEISFRNETYPNLEEPGAFQRMFGSTRNAENTFTARIRLQTALQNERTQHAQLQDKLVVQQNKLLKLSQKPYLFTVFSRKKTKCESKITQLKQAIFIADNKIRELQRNLETLYPTHRP